MSLCQDKSVFLSFFLFCRKIRDLKDRVNYLETESHLSFSECNLRGQYSPKHDFTADREHRSVPGKFIQIRPK